MITTVSEHVQLLRLCCLSTQRAHCFLVASACENVGVVANFLDRCFTTRCLRHVIYSETGAPSVFVLHNNHAIYLPTTTNTLSTMLQQKGNDIIHIYCTSLMTPLKTTPIVNTLLVFARSRTYNKTIFYLI